MKIKKLATALFILLLLSFALISCDSMGGDDDSLSIILSEKNLLLENIGEEKNLTVDIYSQEAVNASLLTWSTSDDKVAVCENGVVKAVGYGVCVIRANYKNVSVSCRVKVWSKSFKFSLSQSTLVLDNIGESAHIEALTDEGQIFTDSADWSSSNPSVAVCYDGVVTAVGYGSCLINATLNSKTVKCLVTVKDPNAQSISIEENEIRLEQNEDYRLNYTVTATNEALTWTSSNEEVAVCIDGTIYAKQKGVCVIIATTQSGISDACVVTVSNYKSNGIIPNKFNFDIPEFPKEVVHISTSTGKIVSAAIISSYEVRGEYGEDGRFYILIRLHGTKTYDIEGMDGTSDVIVSANLFKEENVLGTKGIYRAKNVKVGESFTIDYSLFTIALNSDGTPRKFYMVLDGAVQI